jgi:hypothetical protein
MQWDRETDPDRSSLALALVERVPKSGWREATLSAASEAVFADPTRWRRFFPKGARDAIWYISEASDASMRMPFSSSPALSMSQVIATRFDQNGHLKPFVRKVMLFDVLHPLQAVRRMQRTARVMFECLDRGPMASSRAIAALNAIYTALVFVWLVDRSDGNALTKRLIVRAMRAIGQS